MSTLVKDSNSETGVFLETNGQQIGHAGGDPGIVTFAFFDKNTLKGNIIFMNTSDTDGLVEAIQQIFKILDEHYKEIIE
jgi:hypothetical protein